MRSILNSGLIAEGRESKQGRQTIFFTPLNPFGPNPDEERNSAATSPSREKAQCESKWKTNQGAVYWINLARAQGKGLRASRLHLQGDLAKNENELYSEDSPRPDLRRRFLAIAASAAARYTGRSNFSRHRETVARSSTIKLNSCLNNSRHQETVARRCSTN